MLDYEEIKTDIQGWLQPEPPTEREIGAAERIGHGTYEIDSHKLDVALDEARSVFIRTGVSSFLKSGDLVVGIHNAHGDLVTASCGTYLHAAIAQLPVKYILDHHVNGDSNVDVNPGDIFYTNEALAGGLHNPDQMAIMPVFNDGEIIAWASAAVHQSETGAIEPGGMPQMAKSRYDEGMRLTPIKIAEGYEVRDDLMEMMVNFISRSPQMQEIDVRARCTAVDKLRSRVLDLAEEKGNDHVFGLFRRMIDTAETGTRNRIESWNDGTYRAVSFCDTTGRTESLVKVKLALHKRGDEIMLDFSGSSPEVDGSYNTFQHGVAAFLATYVYPYVFHDLPVSTGTLAPFSFEVPDGSALNANSEAAVCNCVYLGRTVISLCFDAFSRMLYATDPERVAAAPSAHSGGGSFKGTDHLGIRKSDSFAFTLNTDGQGARYDKDGMNAHGFFYCPWGKASNVEVFEEDRIFLGLTRAHLPDAFGFGKRQGGSGTQNINVVVTDDPVEVTSRGKGSRIPHDGGMFGGYASTSLPGISITGSDVLERLEAGEDVPRDVRDIATDRPFDGEYRFERLNRNNRTIERGDVFITLSSGGGGLGDPLERDPESVVEDLETGLISERAAKDVYGVGVTDDGHDEERTEKRRDAEREARLRRGRPYDEFAEEWAGKSPPEEALVQYGSWPDAMEEGDETTEAEATGD